VPWLPPARLSRLCAPYTGGDAISAAGGALSVSGEARGRRGEVRCKLHGATLIAGAVADRDLPPPRTGRYEQPSHSSSPGGPAAAGGRMAGARRDAPPAARRALRAAAARCPAAPAAPLEAATSCHAAPSTPCSPHAACPLRSPHPPGHEGAHARAAGAAAAAAAGPTTGAAGARGTQRVCTQRAVAHAAALQLRSQQSSAAQEAAPAFREAAAWPPAAQRSSGSCWGRPAGTRSS
jgi:hypothetical protein